MAKAAGSAPDDDLPPFLPPFLVPSCVDESVRSEDGLTVMVKAADRGHRGQIRPLTQILSVTLSSNRRHAAARH